MLVSGGWVTRADKAAVFQMKSWPLWTELTSVGTTRLKLNLLEQTCHTSGNLSVKDRKELYTGKADRTCIQALWLSSLWWDTLMQGHKLSLGTDERTRCMSEAIAGVFGCRSWAHLAPSKTPELTQGGRPSRRGSRPGQLIWSGHKGSDKEVRRCRGPSSAMPEDIDWFLLNNWGCFLTPGAIVSA